MLRIIYIERQIAIPTNKRINTYNKSTWMDIAINCTALSSLFCGSVQSVLHVSLRGGSRLCVAEQAWVIQIPPERVIIRTFATRMVTTASVYELQVTCVATNVSHVIRSKVLVHSSQLLTRSIAIDLRLHQCNR